VTGPGDGGWAKPWPATAALDTETHLLELAAGIVDRTGVDPEQLAPLLQIVGEHDHIVPPAASTPLNDAVGTDDERLIEFPAGHVGISVSGRAHRELWPTVCDWYGARSD